MSESLDLEGLEVVSFTTKSKPKHPAASAALTVKLGDEELSAPRPKDGVLFFAQSAVSDNANEADRWSHAWNLVNAVLSAQDRHRFLERVCDRDDPLNAHMFWNMIGQLLDRWNLDSKIPASVPVVVKEEPHPPFPDPVRLHNEDLDLDIVAYPPKDIVLGITASALSQGSTVSDQAWVIGLFLDAALERKDVLTINYRLRSGQDDLDLSELTQMVQMLIERWYDKPVGNRKTRRAAKAKTRKKPRTVQGEFVDVDGGEPVPGQATLDSALEE